LIGAVNTIKFTKKGKLKGYNTDYYGFKKSLEPLLQPHHKKALILGTGGASKGVAFALNELNIPYTFVSREAKENIIDYDLINATTFDNFQIIINCTPVGTSPNITACPNLPYEFFTEKHIAYDLIYNPEETQFLKNAKEHGAVIKNGYDMLIFQAEKAWKIWNK
jgi:shikimate dehydrogenase